MSEEEEEEEEEEGAKCLAHDGRRRSKRRSRRYVALCPTPAADGISFFFHNGGIAHVFFPRSVATLNGRLRRRQMREQHGAGRGRLENCTWAPPPKRKKDGGSLHHQLELWAPIIGRVEGEEQTDVPQKKEGEAVVPFLSSISASDGMEGGGGDAGRGMFLFFSGAEPTN